MTLAAHTTYKLLNFIIFPFHFQILNRENVALVAKFAPKDDPNATFVVATTHLLYNPRRQDVRLAQVQVLLAELDRIAYEDDGRYAPVILTGDLNLKPYSAPYTLLTRGSLQYENLQARTLERNEGNVVERSGKRLLPPGLGITDDCQHAHMVTSKTRNQTKVSV